MANSIGGNSALRSTLKTALDALPAKNLDELLDSTTLNIESLEDLWGNSDSLSIFQRDFIEELKRIQFMIGESKKISTGKITSQKKVFLFCIDCNIIILNAGTDVTCPSCGASKWLDLAGI